MTSGKSKRWLERLIALMLASVMVLVFFERIEKIAIIAERESVQQYLSTTQVGIQMFMLADIVQGNVADMRSYENTNPMRFYKILPSNYAGELSTKEVASIRGGQWYYDKSANQLVYRISHHPLYEGDARKELRYRLQYSDAADIISSLYLKELEEET
jgi:hypothetical protein